MTQQFAHRLTFIILLLCQLSICLATEAPDLKDSSKYLDAVREFADNVLKYGRDTYGPKHTPLFVDGLNIHTHEPVKWIAPRRDGSIETKSDDWYLCNLASQQNLFRTLDGLTKVTSDPKYRQAAMEAIGYAFTNLQSPNGLLYWGIHTAFDVYGDKIIPEDSIHVLKANLPYYELMWQVDPEATKRLIESFWSAHILDWSNLDMNRIGNYDDKLEEPWKHEYDEGPIFLPSGSGISFSNAGADLIHAAAMLTKLSGDEEPLVWAKRLAYRYVRTRHPVTGISYWQYSKPSYDMLDSYDNVMRKLSDVTSEYLVGDFPWFTYSNTKSRTNPTGQWSPTPGVPINEPIFHWQTQFLVGEMLAGKGDEFKQWALEEFTAFGKASYRKQDNAYVPILTDGTNIENYVVKVDSGVLLGPSGGILKPVSASPSDLWSYSMAYRVTRDAFVWEMVRDIALGNDFGDIGMTPKDKTQLNESTECLNPYALLAFLEIYQATEKADLLIIAKRLGDNVLQSRFNKGFFVASSKHAYSKLDAIDSLALLRLHSTLVRGTVDLPEAWPSISYFACPYRWQEFVVDNKLYDKLTESTEMQLSLQEAVATEDINLARSLLDQGADVDDAVGTGKTALQRAVISGNKEMVELLLDRDAGIDIQRGWPGGTPLHLAAQKGHKLVVELLIHRGADVNAKCKGHPKGDTPLHSAARAGHKNIVELLLEKSADINAKNGQGKAPIDIAMDKARMNIASVLIDNGAEASFFTKMRVNMARQEKRPADLSFLSAAQNGELEKVEALHSQGVDINVRDSEGNTPLYYAVRGRHGKLAQFLIEKGADVTVKDTRGMTPLYFAIGNGMDAVAKMLIAHDDIDVNVQTDRGWTPLHMAAAQGHRGIVQSLVNRGADVTVKKQDGKTPLDFATRGGNVEIIEILTKAAEEQKSIEGSTSRSGGRDD